MFDKHDNDSLLTDVEIVLDLYGISATAFGYYAVGDPAIVGRMRKGMTLRPKRRERVERAMRKIQQNGGMPG